MPSPDTALLVGLLVVQQVLHHLEKRDLLSRLGPPPVPPARHIPQKTMAEAMEKAIL